MTAGELLAALGRSWSRLLLYPAGVTALLILLSWLWLTRQRPVASSSLVIGRNLTTALAVVAPWLAIALLPLPGAANAGVVLDALLAVVLLEWPFWVLVSHELSSTPHRRNGLQRLAAVLNAYPLLLLSLALLAFAAGSLRVDAFVAQPAIGSGTWPRVTHWLGAFGLTIALLPLLALGPFTVEEERTSAPWYRLWGFSWPWLGWQLRTVGWLLLAALPWMALLQDWPWSLPLPPLLLGLLLAGIARYQRGKVRRWAWIYLWLALGALSTLALGTLAALQARLS